MFVTLNFGPVEGLSAEELQQLQDLADAYNYHQSRNRLKDKYYEGHVTLQDVNLGIALPQGLRNLEVGCSWGQKAVDVLAARSMFDGFVGTGGSLDSLAKLVADNRLVAQYAKACRDELKYGCILCHPVRGQRHRLQHPVPLACHGSRPLERREGPHRLRPCHRGHREG